MAQSSKKPKSRSSDSSRTTVRRVEADSNSEASSPLRRFIIFAAVVLALLFGYYYLRQNSTDQDKVSDDQIQSKTDDSKKASDNASKSQDDKKTGANDSSASNTSGQVSSNMKESDKSYDYTVAEGASYTELARQAIAKADGSLSKAERVAAETRLVQSQGAGELAAGQDVRLSKEQVRESIEWAKSLSPDEKAAWQPYADLVAW